VFDNLSSLPYQHKVTEALDILIAGADTTASTLTAGLMHILSNPEIHAKLVDALGGVKADYSNFRTFQLIELEKVDYLVSESR
jgi:cytochrome P450